MQLAEQLLPNLSCRNTLNYPHRRLRTLRTGGKLKYGQRIMAARLTGYFGSTSDYCGRVVDCYYRNISHFPKRRCRPLQLTLSPSNKKKMLLLHFGHCNAPICAFGVAVLALCSIDLYRAGPATYPSGEEKGRSNMVGTGQRFRC